MSCDSPSWSPTVPRGPVRTALLGCLALSLFLSSAGCGKKGDPLPPLRFVPAAAQDLSVRQEGGLILLELAYPRATVGGQPLDGIDTIELWMIRRPMASLEDPPAEVELREFEATAEPVVTLRGSELEGAVIGDRLQFKLPLGERGDQIESEIYAVRTSKGIEVSKFSNLAPLVPRAAPAPPANLQLEARPTGVVVTWEADEDPEAFDVFRRRATERGYGERLRRVQGDARRVVDRSAAFGSRYIYTVRTVAGEDPLVYSDPAGEREITYEDRFAPPIPTNFVALPERGAIRLRWDASDADDVAGYVLYRRVPGRTDFARLTAEPVVQEEYFDSNLASGLTFAYRIQAIDREGNESELSEPVTATSR